MIRLAALVLAVLAWASASAHAQNAPESLRNRSFLVTWSETRDTETPAGPRNISVAFRMTVFVSSAGRAFARLTATGPRDSASQDTVGGSGKSLGSGVRTVTMRGNTILIQSNFGSAARQIAVDAPAGGCSARVQVGKLQGAGAVTFTRTDGKKIVIRSISAGTASCQASAGNTFAQ